MKYVIGMLKQNRNDLNSKIIEIEVGKEEVPKSNIQAQTEMTRQMLVFKGRVEQLTKALETLEPRTAKD